MIDLKTVVISVQVICCLCQFALIYDSYSRIKRKDVSCIKRDWINAIVCAALMVVNLLAGRLL